MLYEVITLAWAIALSRLYGRSERWVRAYERVLKYMVWGIVLCFGLVVVMTGVDWGALAREILEAEVTLEHLKEIEAGDAFVSRRLWSKLAEANLLGLSYNFV